MSISRPRNRPRVHLTLADDTVDRLDTIDLVLAERPGRGRIVDALVGHPLECSCPICHAVRSMRKQVKR